MKEKPKLEQFVSVRTAAESLDCTLDFIYSKIGTGELRAVKMGTRAVRISLTSLNDMINSSWIDPETYQADMEPEKPKPQRRAPGQIVVRSSWMAAK